MAIYGRLTQIYMYTCGGVGEKDFVEKTIKSLLKCPKGCTVDLGLSNMVNVDIIGSHRCIINELRFNRGSTCAG